MPSISAPTTFVIEALFIVTVHIAVFPFFVETVIMAVPLDTAVMLPVASTLAIFGLSLFHVTDLSIALLGKIVAVSVAFAPISRVSDV